MAACASAQIPRFTPADTLAWRDILDPRISADGTHAVYIETAWQPDSASLRANLRLVSTDGKTRRTLTSGACSDTSPRWSPDGSRLAFLSDRTGTPQIFVRRLDSADDRQLTLGGAAPLSLAWSPDGNTLAFTATVTEPLPGIAWAPVSLLPQLRTKRTRLFLISAGGGQPRAVPLGDLTPHGEPAWMPDGGSLLLALTAPFDPDHPLEGSEIYALRLADSQLRRLTTHPGPDTDPLPSPDGSRIAWIARDAAPQSYITPRLWVANPDGSRARSLAGALDRDPRHPQWSNDSRTLYFVAEDHGAAHVYSARNDGSVRQVTRGPERLHGFAVADTGQAVAVRSPGELITFPVDLPAQPVVLASPNQALLSSRQTGIVEAMTYSSGTRTIEAWVTRPPGFDPARRYPLLLDIDDAPPRMCGPEFRLRSQVLAAAGMLVLCANPRGTPGYGEAFANLIHSAIPGDAFDDLNAGVDAVIAKGSVDPARVSIAGGLLAAWAIGHSERFHAAVARRPIVDFALDAATSPDGAQRAAAWMGALPWMDPEQYVKHSPLYQAGSFKTPTLILAGTHDPAAEELHFALRMRKTQAALVRVANPAQELEAMLGWLSR